MDPSCILDAVPCETRQFFRTRAFVTVSYSGWKLRFNHRHHPLVSKSASSALITKLLTLRERSVFILQSCAWENSASHNCIVLPFRQYPTRHWKRSRSDRKSFIQLRSISSKEKRPLVVLFSKFPIPQLVSFLTDTETDLLYYNLLDRFSPHLFPFGR